MASCRCCLSNAGSLTAHSLIRVIGTAFLLDVPALDVERLRAALHALIQHHDALRLTFTSEDSLHWRQGYQPMTDAIELRCHHVERSAPQWQEALSAVLTEWQSDIDLADGPLYRLVMSRV